MAMHMMGRRTGALAAVALLGAAAWLMAGRGGPAPAVRSVVPGLDTWLHAGMGSDHRAVARPPRFRTGLEALPASLRGTAVPGQLRVDMAGNLQIDRGVRDLFDYFLSANSEEAAAVTRARIAAYAGDHLPARAAAQLLTVYDQYVDYKQRVETAMQSLAGGNDLDQMKARLALLRRVRAETLSADVVQAFFSDDDVGDDYALARATILQDGTLSATDKARKLAALREALPDAVRQSMSVVETVQTLDAVTADWKQRGGSPAELRSIRESLVGPAAADRLEALDQQTALWDARVQRYLAQRAQILQDPSLSGPMRQQQIEALREQGFSSAELVRVGALERIRDAAGNSGATP